MGDILHIRSRTDSLSRALKHIDDPVARKLVILSKRDRRQITDRECERLIQMCGVVEA
jgi:hypothetical protein